MRAIRMRCDGCGDVRERWTSGLGLGKHRVLGVVCGTWSVVLDDDESSYLDDIPSLPDENAPRYVTQVEEAQARWGGGVVTTLDALVAGRAVHLMQPAGNGVVCGTESAPVSTTDAGATTCPECRRISDADPGIAAAHARVAREIADRVLSRFPGLRPTTKRRAAR